MVSALRASRNLALQAERNRPGNRFFARKLSATDLTHLEQREFSSLELIDDFSRY